MPAADRILPVYLCRISYFVFLTSKLQFLKYPPKASRLGDAAM